MGTSEVARLLQPAESQAAPLNMDIKVVLNQCAGVDKTLHKCPGKVKDFFRKGDDAVCECECHKK